MKLVRRIGRDVDRIPCADDRLLTSKRRLDFPLQHNERLLKIVAMRRRTTSRRNVHIDHAKPAGRVFAADGDRVRVAHQADVFQACIGLSETERAFQVIGC